MLLIGMYSPLCSVGKQHFLGGGVIKLEKSPIYFYDVKIVPNPPGICNNNHLIFFFFWLVGVTPIPEVLQDCKGFKGEI